MEKRKRIIVGIAGSSAPQYGIWFMKAMSQAHDIETHLVLSDGAVASIHHEAPEWSIDQIKAMADVVHDNHNLAASISSGSFKTDGMAIIPCSMRTLAAVANSLTSDLLTRAADVCLKERRRLVLVTRETPLHKGHLENMMKVTDMGGVILPPVPAFYHKPKTIEDIINHTVGKVFDLLGLEHNLFTRWQEGEQGN